MGQIQRFFISYSSQPSYVITSSSTIPRPYASRLFGVVDVVDELLNNGGGVGGLGLCPVDTDHGAGAGTDDDGALLALLE